MRKKLMWIVILCLSAAWLMAQQEPTGAQAGSSGQSATQSAPSGQSASPSAQPPSPSAPDTGAASPSAQSGAAGQSAPGAGAAGQGAEASITEGCLGGAQPNYTLTDKNGTTYKLVTPPNADVSILAKHIGEPIAVMGTVDKGSGSSASSGSVAGSAGASASSSSQPSIQVTKIGRGTGQCPASSGGATPKQ